MARSEEKQRALVVLNPQESKRLIGRAVAALPEVVHACKNTRLIIGHGTTNAYVAEELLGRKISKWRYTAGMIAGGRLDVSPGEKRLSPLALKRGKPFPGGWVELLREFEKDDVFIKGANALDAKGNVGVLLASDTGGTVGQIFGIVSARGSHLIAPVGLEKLIPDVVEAARHCGMGRIKIADGYPSGMAVLSNAKVITEVQAFGILFGVEAWHVASGGICGSEGAVVLALEGSATAVARAFKYTNSIAMEPKIERE